MLTRAQALKELIFNHIKDYGQNFGLTSKHIIELSADEICTYYVEAMIQHDISVKSDQYSLTIRKMLLQCFQFA